MIKDIYLTGRECTGKTLLAKILFDSDEAFFINARNPKLFENHFLFDGVTEKTKYIIFDDISQKISMDCFFQLQNVDFLKINAPFKDVINIKKPVFILISNHLPNNQSSSFFRRFKVYNIDQLRFKEIMELIKKYHLVIKNSWNI